MTKVERKARHEALVEARASIRADILLDPNVTVPQILERVTRTLDAMIAKVEP